MGFLDTIYSLLPDNSSKKIKAKDVRSAFEKFDERIVQVENRTAMGYVAELKKDSIAPNTGWEIGLYRLLEIGIYPNLTPSVDVDGSNSPIEGREGKINEAYFDGTTWSKSEVEMPTVQVDQVFNPDSADPVATREVAKRYDGLRRILNFFNYPYEEVWEEIPMPMSGEVDNAYLHGNFNAIVTDGTAYGNIPLSVFDGYSLFKMEGDFTRLGSGAIWLARINDASQTLAKLLTDTPAYTEFKVNKSVFENDTKLAYSRIKGQTKFYRGKLVPKVLEEDAIKKYIDAKASGYSGEIDLASRGLKESNTASTNTAIINHALLEAEANKKIVRMPSGIFKVNTINLRQDSIFLGAGVFKTKLVGEPGAGSTVVMQKNSQPQARVTIGDMWIDCEHFTDGGIFLNLTFDARIFNLIIFNAKKYSMYLEKCLYHKLDDIYIENSEENGIWTVDSLAMANNLCVYNRVYIVGCKKLSARLEKGSNYVFNSCNFENGGTAGDPTTGGVLALNLSPLNEGVDVVFNNCWSEGIRGGFIYKFEGCNGYSIIRDSMLGNGGNGAGNIANAIWVVNSIVGIEGATRFSQGYPFTNFPINVRNEGGTVYYTNPMLNIGTNNVGNILKPVYN